MIRRNPSDEAVHQQDKKRHALQQSAKRARHRTTIRQPGLKKTNAFKSETQKPHRAGRELLLSKSTIDSDRDS
jgi:hypothetical protein